MTRHAIPSTALLAVLCVAPLPAAAQSREQQQILVEIQQSQAQTQQLRSEVAALAEAVKVLTAVVNSQNDANRTAKAETQTLIKNLDDEVTKLGEKVSQSSRDVARFSGELQAIRDNAAAAQQAVKELNAKVDQLIAVVTGQNPMLSGGGGSAPGGIGAATTPAPPNPTPTTSASPGLYWAQAMNMYTKGDYVSAVQAFQEFINKFPDHPDAAKAQLFVVNSFRQDLKYKEALDAATSFIDNPQHKSAAELPDFYFNKGAAQEMLKMRPEAIATYKFVVATYPNSDAALQASNALKRLNVK